MDTVEARVARGLAWIQAHADQGFDVSRIDVDRLDVSDYHNCPLAQAKGQSFDNFRDSLQDHEDPSSSWLVRHGFDWEWDAEDHVLDTLNDQWRRVLTAASVA